MSGAIIAAVIPLLPVAAGVLALVLGAALLRSFGPRYRVGRLIGSTPEVGVAEAIALVGGPARYVKIGGRIDAEDTFEDHAHRPLVLRRSRVQVWDGDRWRTVEDGRETRPFEVRDGLDGIAIDADALDDGLVVMPRESVGTAADLPDRVPEGTPPDTSVRMLIEQVSSIDHALVMGVPQAGADGLPRMGAGLGRPLVLTTLAPDEAMRVLAGDRSRRALWAAISLAAGFVLITVGIVWQVVDAIL
jgi:hypothetical protein